MGRPRSSRPAPAGRRRFRLLWLYPALLALSHLVRLVSSGPQPLPAGVAAIELAAVVDGDRRLEYTRRVAYREWAPDPGAPAGRRREAVVLLHGSPGSGSNFLGLGPLLAAEHRVVAPDLPGFGHSHRRVPDYSIRAHAVYVRDLLAELGIDRAHVVGFSMGGGVALHLAELAPQRIRSLVLLSAIGVQEHELLGQYHLNHALHALELAGLWLLHEATPHFGLLDGFLLDVPFARNFYDSDQRPLRGMLERFEPPMLILHGRRDPLVPFSAAREHHRIVPQSELWATDDSHFMVFLKPGRLAPPLLDFIARVESGAALVRSQAAAERIAAAAEPPPPPSQATGFALVAVLVLLAVATLVSEDLTCIAAGLLVARGSLGFVPAAAACGVGIFLGDLMLYGVGRLGWPWLDRPPLRWLISPRDVARGKLWFKRRGAMMIFLSRFLPGARLPIYVAAGALRTRFWWFAANLFLPVALWTPLLVGFSRSLGDRFFETFEVFQSYALAGFAVLLVSLWLLLAVLRRLSTYRGRRLLLGWWRRLTRWEFWPPWAIYPPVVLQVVWLGLRYRSWTLFTAANPGLPAGGGFVGESKSDILEKVGPTWRARLERIPARASVAEKLAACDRFRAQAGTGYPIVLKPDQGHRGHGVAVVHDRRQAEEYFRRGGTPRDVIVQEYVGGAELGIFYVRLPGEARGRIFSITEKVFPVLVGDGRSTLERLILADPRAVILAPVYLRHRAAELERTPAAGEKVQLVDVGSHSGGTICRDGAGYKSEALEEEVDRLSRSLGGFYFGRIDLRAPSIEDFRHGRGLKVLEVNGVTSEATHIYDPAVSVAEAYRVLFEQWRLAFEIGARNRDRGFRPLTAGDLVRLLLAYRRGAAVVDSPPGTKRA